MIHRVTIVALVLALAGPAAADRYVIQLNDGPPAYVPDAQEMVQTLQTQSGMTPPTPATLAALTLPATPAPAVVAVNPDPNPAGSRMFAAVARADGQEPTDVESLLTEPTSPPTPEFLAVLQRIYSINNQDEVNAIWARYTTEPETLNLDQRVGNSVVKFILAINRPPSGDSTARPDLLNPNATRATVRATNGVGVRADPWGNSGGAAIPGGSALEVIPPASGPWYKVRTGSGTGWVCGIWLDLQ